MVGNYEQMSRKSDTDYVGGAIPSIWKTNLSSKIPIFTAQKHSRHRKDIIAAFGLEGPSTIYSAAEFVLQKEKIILEKKQKNIKSIIPLISKRETIYSRIIKGRKKHKKSLSLLSQNYLFLVSKKPDKYFLTLKGAIIALGFQYTNLELNYFITNAAKFHLFFAFLKKMLDNDINIGYVKNVFVKPISIGFETNKIPFDENLFYYNNIAEQCGIALWKKIKIINSELERVNEERRTAKPRQISIGYEGLLEGIDLQKFLEIYPKLLPQIRSRLRFATDLSELYEPNLKWREKIIKKLYGRIKYPYEILEDNSEQFRLLLYILLHIDIATVNAFE